MRRSPLLYCTLALLGSLSVAAAHASTIDLFSFSISGLPGAGTASIAASPTPGSFSATSFTLPSVSATYLGDTFSGPVTFLSSGGASADGSTFTGDTLFTGLTSAPTFRLGTFSLNGIADLGAGPLPVTVSLTISEASAPPVPEPAPLVLLGTSALGLIEIVRRRLAA